MEEEKYEVTDKIILREYIKDLECKLKESDENLVRQKRINERVVNNYEYLDQEYDKIYSLLTEDQKDTLNIKLDRSLRN